MDGLLQLVQREGDWAEPIRLTSVAVRFAVLW